MSKVAEETRMMLYVTNITIPEHRMRNLNDEAVIRMAGSFKILGQKTPITVRMDGDDIILVAGLHRLHAAKQLGWDRIEAEVFEGDEVDARLWEIAENLCRSELTVQERAEHIAEWVRLTEERQRDAAQLAPHQPKKAGQQPGGINAAVRELHIDRTEAQRAVKINKIAPEAKAAAKEAGIDNNQSALLRVASEATAENQLEAIRRERERAESHKRNRETDRTTAQTEAQLFAEWLTERMARNGMPKIISWLEGCKSKDVTAAMRQKAA
jgi:ParB/RepB/Spo0J family partition protein